MQYGKAMWDAEYPGGAGSQTVGQIIAVVEEAIGRIAAAAVPGAGEVAVTDGAGGKGEQLLAQAGFLCEQKVLSGALRMAAREVSRAFPRAVASTWKPASRRGRLFSQAWRMRCRRAS